MALTEAQVNKVSKILGVSKRLVTAHITSLGDDFTAQDETDVIAEITRWDAGAGTNFVKIHPKESNFGAETNAGNDKADIRKNIAVLLEFDLAIYNRIGSLPIGL